MKNLVTAFAACMIAGLVSADGVESQNIVGYSTISLPQGFSFVTAPFIPVGGNGTVYTLGQITPNDNWSALNSDTIQFIDATGNTVLTAWYYSGYGWCDFNDTSTMLDDYQLPSGISGFVEATQADAQFVVAGQVATNALSVALSQGFQLVGNSVPRNITLGDIVPNENWNALNSDTIQFIDATGNTVLTAWYYSGYGWCDFNDTSTMLDDTVITPGEGFFLEATQTDAALTFPKAI